MVRRFIIAPECSDLSSVSRFFYPDIRQAWQKPEGVASACYVRKFTPLQANVISGPVAGRK